MSTCMSVCACVCFYLFIILSIYLSIHLFCLPVCLSINLCRYVYCTHLCICMYLHICIHVYIRICCIYIYACELERPCIDRCFRKHPCWCKTAMLCRTTFLGGARPLDVQSCPSHIPRSSSIVCFIHTVSQHHGGDPDSRLVVLVHVRPLHFSSFGTHGL